MDLRQKIIKQLTYDSNTGIFTNIKGKVVGSTKGRPYSTVWVNLDGQRKRFDAHRLAFLIMTGNIPKYVDHIDGNGYNNKWCNLRAANSIENARNSKIRKDNTSGYKGVSYFKSRNKWTARIGIIEDGKHIYKNLGYFSTPEEAFGAYKLAALKYHKDFHNFGE